MTDRKRNVKKLALTNNQYQQIQSSMKQAIKSLNRVERLLEESNGTGIFDATKPFIDIADDCLQNLSRSISEEAESFFSIVYR